LLSGAWQTVERLTVLCHAVLCCVWHAPSWAHHKSARAPRHAAAVRHQRLCLCSQVDVLHLPSGVWAAVQQHATDDAAASHARLSRVHQPHLLVGHLLASTANQRLHTPCARLLMQQEPHNAARPDSSSQHLLPPACCARLQRIARMVRACLQVWREGTQHRVQCSAEVVLCYVHTSHSPCT
jgi:hypothetical protein